MDHIEKGQVTSFLDFLHILSDWVKGSRGSSAINKTQCQTMKETLNRMVHHSCAEVSTIRSVLYYVEKGKLDNLTTENVEKALEEYRQLVSDSQREKSEHHHNHHHHHHHQQQQGMIRSTRSRDREEDQTMRRSLNLGKRDHDMKKEEEMAREINELKMRLSSMAGDKLKDGNPSLADLDDPNRPTCIAEQYRELYDNDWTNALEEYTKDRFTEEQAILKLGDILQQIYEITRNLSIESTKSMTHVIKESLSNIGNGNQHNKQSRGNGKETTRSITAHVLAIRRENVEMSIPSVQDHCMEELSRRTRKRLATHADRYAMQCARLTWLMNIQDPPLVLKWAKKGDHFDPQYFSEFTRSGTIVEFTSWPALLIHENGAILAKGTAQPSKK